MIAIVDYAKGNLRSVQKGLESAGACDVRVVVDPADIVVADAVVLPGVGAFADASASLVASGQMQAVRAAIDTGKPFLGICLGLHLLFEAGTEGASEGELLPQGLGVIPGIVDRMARFDAQGRSYKVPHVGWNSIDLQGRSPLLNDIAQGEYFYFTHSYVAPENEFTQATTTHADPFPCFVDVGGTCFGIQFHPEKSSTAGLKVLRNFVALVNERSASCTCSPQ